MSFTTLKSIKYASIICALFVSNAYALQSDSNQPINIASDEQFADLKDNKAVFSGNVEATQGFILLKADKAEIIRNKDGSLKSVKTFGHPTTFKQKQDDGKIIRSQSSSIEYYPQHNLVVLSGRATIWQDNSHVNGERIEYNTLTQKLKASNNNNQGGRVRSTFIPQELKSNKQKN